MCICLCVPCLFLNILPSERQGPVGGKGILALASLRQAARKRSKFIKFITASSKDNFEMCLNGSYKHRRCCLPCCLPRRAV